MLTLYTGTKKYSSWSLRPWSLLREVGIEFEDIVIPFEAIPGFREFTDAFKLKASQVHPSSRVPVLHDGKIIVWETLAICEYVSREYCDDSLWPRERMARAFAQSLATEVQSEFALIRSTLPFWCTKQAEKKVILPFTVQIEWERLISALSRALDETGGPFLFGEYSIVDAMVLPMMSRASTYLDLNSIPVSVRTYLDFVLSRPSYLDWVTAAHNEVVILPELEKYAEKLIGA